VNCRRARRPEAAEEQKAQEAKARTAELQRAKTALEQKEAELQHKEAELQGKEAELQCDKATAATLSGTLEEKEVAIRNAAAALKEKPPCPRSKGPSESCRRKRRRISWVSARDFTVIGF